MQDDFLFDLGVHLASMRLIAEGALSMYENEVSNLYGKAVREDNTHDALYIDLMGWALSLLSEHVCAVQDAYARLSSGQNAHPF